MATDPGAQPADRRTLRWLSSRFQAHVGANVPGARVFDDAGRPCAVTPYAFRRLVRKLKILRCLEGLEFESFIDVASGWEHLPYLVRERHGADTFYSDLVHDLNLPSDGEHYGKVDHAVTLKLPALPFRDGAFDVVLCSEVLEHLVRPVEAIAELTRVARRYVILTSLEALSVDRWQRWLSHQRIDVRVPHVERNFFLMHELRAIFGDGVHTENLLFDDSLPARLFAPPAEQARAHAALNDRAALEAALCRAVSEGRHGAGAFGVVVLKALPGAPLRAPTADHDPELARWLVDKAVEEECFAETALAVWAAFFADPSKRPKDEADRPVATELLARLRCPDCRGALDRIPTGVRCTGCARSFAASYGVPLLVPGCEPGAAPSEQECLDRLCGDDAGRRAVVARIMRRLRRNERAPGRVRRAVWWLDRHMHRPGDTPPDATTPPGDHPDGEAR